MLSVVKKLFTSSALDSLSKKTAKGSFWLLVFRIFSQGLGFIRTIVLARLLAPSDFGLFGIALMALSFLETFSQSGFQSALIHKKGDIKPYLDTSFVVQAVRGLLIALILFFSAPYVALFFQAEAAVPILKLIAVAIFIQGLTNIATIYLQKELEFKKYFLYQVSGTLADFFISVVLAIMFRNVWALAIGYLAGIILRCVVSYMIYFYKPRLHFDIGKAKELVGYGKWVFSSNIIGFFMSQIDSFFVAKISGITSLGFYQVAYKIPSILNLEVLAGATFPAYSKMQDDIPKLREAYLKITKMFAMVLMPMAGGIFVLIPQFIILFLGEKWLPALWPMRILSLSALIWTMAVVSDYMFMAVGKPYVQARWSAVRLLVMAIFLYPFILAYGLAGAAMVVLAGSLVATLGLTVEAIKTVQCGVGRFIHNILFLFMGAFIMALSIYMLKNILGTGIFSFLVLIAVGMVIYFILTLIFDKLFGTKTIQLLKESIRLLG
ncbi:MAG: lipopolysaccharide biosynthesis protein [Candidatus Staskawiczbacteria bacterium]|nr:lipopolysaccharide biosynthesis protein [Candidatus Staskawiczbacteria bacterium]